MNYAPLVLNGKECHICLDNIKIEKSWERNLETTLV